jgi:hypothetical protein
MFQNDLVVGYFTRQCSADYYNRWAKVFPVVQCKHSQKKRTLHQAKLTFSTNFKMLKLLWSYFQWIQCDLRSLDLSVLGKFAVLMADPPWDIHMELPYGTMSDDEMRRLPIPSLQVNLTTIIDTLIHP